MNQQDCARYRGAVLEQQIDQRHVSRARRIGKRHGAEPVARLDRRAGGEQGPHERFASFIRRREQDGVELHRGEFGFDQSMPTLDLAAGRALGGARRNGRSGTGPCGDDQRERSTNPGVDRGIHRPAGYDRLVMVQTGNPSIVVG